MDAKWHTIKQEITTSLANAGYRVYVSISDILGNNKITDDQLDPYEDVIKQSIQTYTNFLGIGDYAIPLSSKNLMIFKISKKSLVILFATKGNIAQLLSFKKNIDYFAKQIDQLIGDIEVPAEVSEAIPPFEVKKIEKKVSKQIFGKEMPIYYPSLTKKIGDKFKATMEEIGVLHLCDGQHSFTDIVELTKQPQLPVFDFLGRQIKKKVVRIEAYPFLIECPDCQSKHPFFVTKSVFEPAEDPFKLLIRSEMCNHDYVAFISHKFKIETQSFKYFTDFQRDKFMKRLGAHYYTIIS